MRIIQLLFIVIVRHDAIWFAASLFYDEIASCLVMTGVKVAFPHISIFRM